MKGDQITNETIKLQRKYFSFSIDGGWPELIISQAYRIKQEAVWLTCKTTNHRSIVMFERIKIKCMNKHIAIYNELWLLGIITPQNIQ